MSPRSISKIVQSLLIFLLTTTVNNFVRGSAKQMEVVIGLCASANTTEGQGSIRSLALLEMKRALGALSTGVTADVRELDCGTEEPISTTSISRVKQNLSSVAPTVVIGSYSPIVQIVTAENRIPYFITSTPSPLSLPSHHRIDSSLAGSRDDVRDVMTSFYMTPAADQQYGAIVDLTAKMNWKDVAVIYDDEYGLQLMGVLMRAKPYTLGALSQTTPPFVIRGWKLDASVNDDVIRNDLLNVRQLSIRYVIVACRSSGLLDRVLKMGMRLSMLSYIYSWFVADMESSQTINYLAYSDTQVNLTTFRLPGDDAVNSVSNVTTVTSSLVNVLTMDAVMSVGTAITQLIKTGGNQRQALQSSAAKSELLNLLRYNVLDGITGRIEFDSRGVRTNVSLQVMSLGSNGTQKVGMWYQEFATVDQRLKMPDVNRSALYVVRSSPLGARVRVVTIVTDPPFVALKNDHAQRFGNDRFEGYLVEMLEHIAKVLDFKYELYESPDGNYGSKNSKGEWNGMIRELMIGNASMCLGAISITSVREDAVDFTKPFKQKKFNFLMRKPSPKTSAFQFLWPLSTEVWLLTISAMFAVGLLLFIMDRLSPNSQHSEERFNLHESLFFTYGTLVGPGTEMVPRTMSGRVLSMAWWFFGMILVSSYTANLAAFLTVTKIEAPIKSVADLAAQREVKYGTVKNTYAQSMFKSSQVEVYKKMWAFMDSISPDSMVDNATHGIQKIRTENYAFIWDQPINDFIVMNECDLWSTGEPFDEKGYGIGVPMGAAFRDDLTMAILSMQESGEMKRLEDKWWGGGICPPFKETSTSGKELNIHNVAGVFLVLAIGAGLGLFVCFIEFVCHKIARHLKHMKKTVKMAPKEEEEEEMSIMTNFKPNGPENAA